MSLDEQIVLPKSGISVEERVRQIIAAQIPFLDPQIEPDQDNGEIIGVYELSHYVGPFGLTQHVFAFERVYHPGNAKPHGIVVEFLRGHTNYSGKWELETSRSPRRTKGETNRQPNEVTENLGKTLGFEQYSIQYATGQRSPLFMPLEVHTIYLPFKKPVTYYFLMPARSELARLAEDEMKLKC